MSKTLSMIAYIGTAAVLGIVWFLGLHLSPFTSDFLIESFKAFDLSKSELVMLFAVSSVLVALMFRDPILRVKGWGNWIVALLLPFIGTFFVIFGCVLFESIREGFNFLHTWAAFVNGYIAAICSIFLVFPLGLASQYIMRWVGSWRPRLER